MSIAEPKGTKQAALSDLEYPASINGTKCQVHEEFRVCAPNGYSYISARYSINGRTRGPILLESADFNNKLAEGEEQYFMYCPQHQSIAGEDSNWDISPAFSQAIQGIIKERNELAALLRQICLEANGTGQIIRGDDLLQDADELLSSYDISILAKARGART